MNGKAKTARDGIIGTLVGAATAGGLGWQVNSELADALEAKEESYHALVQQCIERIDHDKTGP